MDRKISNNMPSFPTKLQHHSRTMAGLRFIRPTDIIISIKMVLIHRAQLQSNEATKRRGGNTNEVTEVPTSQWSDHQGDPPPPKTQNAGH